MRTRFDAIYVPFPETWQEEWQRIQWVRYRYKPHEIWIVGIDEGAKPGEDDEDASSTNTPPSNKQIISMTIISRSLLVAVRESDHNLRM